MSVDGALVHAPPQRRRGREAAITFGVLVAWMLALTGLAWATQMENGTSAAPVPGMVGLFLAAWGTAEVLVKQQGMVWPGSMLGLVGPICLGFGAPMATAGTRALPADQQMAIVTAISAAGMFLFLFRFRLAALVSPIVTFTVVTLFLSIRGVTPATIREVEGFSPRGILAALVGDPKLMALFGTIAVLCMVWARWLDLKGQEFGMASAKPLHFVGSGVTALIAGRLAAALPWPVDLAVLLALFAAGMAWALRIDRIGVMLTVFFAMARPLVLTLLQLTGGTMAIRDWSVAHSAVLGVGLVLWPVLRKRTLAAGFTTRPRSATWNWPDRVIYPYRPPPGHR